VTADESYVWTPAPALIESNRYRRRLGFLLQETRLFDPPPPSSSTFRSPYVLLLAKGGILPHYDRTMIAITEEIIEEILAFGTDPKAMAFPINRRALHKYYHHRCCCGKTVGEGLKACFGLTEASIDNNGTPIVLHVLPEQSDEDSAALWESVVAWVLSHPEFWHRTAKAIARDYQDVDYGLVVTQGVFIVKRQIDGVDMERAKVPSTWLWQTRALCLKY
jgi:hypothetical protein